MIYAGEAALVTVSPTDHDFRYMWDFFCTHEHCEWAFPVNNLIFT